MTGFMSGTEGNGCPHCGRDFPPANLYSDGESYVIVAEVPGCDPADISIDFCGGLLRLSGRMPGTDRQGGRTIMAERRDASFERFFELPGGLDADSAEAILDSGLLTVRLPVSVRSRPVRIGLE